jgi:hypothetical protein
MVERALSLQRRLQPGISLRNHGLKACANILPNPASVFAEYSLTRSSSHRFIFNLNTVN